MQGKNELTAHNHYRSKQPQSSLQLAENYFLYPGGICRALKLQNGDPERSQTGYAADATLPPLQQDNKVP